MQVNHEIVNKSADKPTKYRWFVAGLFFVIYTIAAADRANLGVALPFLRKEFQMNNAEAGALVSLFLLAYALIQLPSAWLLSKFGVRKVFPIAMILTSIATGLTGTVSSLGALKMCRVGLGIAEGPLPLEVTATINNWFPSKEKGTASGIFLSAVKFGPVVTPIIGAAIIAAYGWKEIFLFFAIPGILLSVIWYALVTNKPSESRFVNQAELDCIRESATTDLSNANSSTYSSSKPIPWLDKFIRVREEKILDTNLSIFKSWNVIGCALGYCFQLGISSILLAWIPTYLLKVKQFSLMGMGFAAAAPWVGAVAGNLVGGYLSDKVLGKRRKPGMLLSAVATAGMMYILISSPTNPTLFSFLLFMTGFLLSIGFSAYMVYPMSFVAKEKFPVANAIVNMGGQLGGAATPFIAGLLLDSFGWDYVFAFMAISSFMTFFIVLTISEPLKIAKD